MSKPPKGWEMRELGEFLTQQQFKEVLKIMKTPHYHERLTTYLASIPFSKPKI